MTTAKVRCATGYCFIKRSNRTGGRLSRYIPQHTLGCLTRQGVTELVRQVNAATLVQETWILLNMQEGKMVIEFEASDRTELEKWFVPLFCAFLSVWRHIFTQSTLKEFTCLTISIRKYWSQRNGLQSIGMIQRFGWSKWTWTPLPMTRDISQER